MITASPAAPYRTVHVVLPRAGGNKVSDTTARARWDECIAAGVFDGLATEALAAYEKNIGLDLTDVAVDGSLHKSPGGGDGQFHRSVHGPGHDDRCY